VRRSTPLLAAFGACAPAEPAPLDLGCPVESTLAGDLVLEGPDAGRALDAVCGVHQRVEGDVVVRGSGLLTLELDCLCEISGDLVLDTNLALATVEWDSLLFPPRLAGDLLLHDNPSLLSLTTQLTVEGDVIIDDVPRLAALELDEVGGSFTWIGSPDDPFVGALSVDIGASLGGDLTVSGLPPASGGTTASVAFPELEEVGGGLALTDHRGGAVLAPRLATLGGDLVLADSAELHVELPLLEVVPGAVRLTRLDSFSWVPPTLGGWTVGDLDIEAVAGPTEIGLPVIAATGRVWVIDNPDLVAVDLARLTAVGGEVRIQDNLALTELTTAGTTVGGDLRVRGSPLGETLSIGPFRGAVVGAVELVDALIDAPSLTALTAIGGELFVERSTFCANSSSALASVGGALTFLDSEHGFLGSLATVDGPLTLHGAPSASVDYPELTAVSALAVTENPNLVWFAAKQLATASAITVIDNPQLVGAPETPALSELDSVILTDLPSLATLSGLSGLVSADELVLARADALVTLQGLEALAAVGELRLEANASLLELDALLSLDSVEGLTIVDNPLLSATEIDAFLASVGYIGTATITGNGS
jgi:hypothetical protein